jgi:hypothetical protein
MIEIARFLLTLFMKLVEMRQVNCLTACAKLMRQTVRRTPALTPALSPAEREGVATHWEGLIASVAVTAAGRALLPGVVFNL